jgi:hypothetical protein
LKGRDMKENIVLAAIIVGAAIVGAAVILQSGRSQIPSTAQCNCSSRFQISVGANTAFIIDTSTGRTWETHLASHTGLIDDDFRKVKLQDQKEEKPTN